MPVSVDLCIGDRVATITLNRPAALNALTGEMRASLRDAWRAVDGDEDVLAVVLTGAGDRSFCTGADLKDAAQHGDSFVQQTFGDPASQHLLSGMGIDKPIICAINGYAIGGGLEIAMACDIRIAADHAEFGMPEPRVGSMPGSGGTQLLPRLVGRSMAMHMLLTGDRIDAATALRCGLVGEVVAGDRLADRAMEVARRIASNAPLSVRAIKAMVLRGSDAPLDSALAMERYAFGLLRDSDDRQEGREAFREKRAPRFRGR